MNQILDKLFGSPVRVKLLRFFLQNPYQVFTRDEISRVTKLRKPVLKKELGFLLGADFLRKGIKETEVMVKGPKEPRRKKEPGFELSQGFPFTRELRALVIEACPIPRDTLVRRFKALGGKVRLVFLSGAFVNAPTAGIPDIFVVSDSARKNTLQKILGKLESEMGKELTYAFMSTEEFKYRQGMYDKFVRDILESEHDKLIDTLEV
ncbi:MAG: hypothetical protein AAB846_00400 [Patescibacteria group bacterium]